MLVESDCLFSDEILKILNRLGLVDEYEGLIPVSRFFYLCLKVFQILGRDLTEIWTENIFWGFSGLEISRKSRRGFGCGSKRNLNLVLDANKVCL